MFLTPLCRFQERNTSLCLTLTTTRTSTKLTSPRPFSASLPPPANFIGTPSSKAPPWSCRQSTSRSQTWRDFPTLPKHGGCTASSGRGTFSSCQHSGGTRCSRFRIKWREETWLWIFGKYCVFASNSVMIIHEQAYIIILYHNIIIIILSWPIPIPPILWVLLIKVQYQNAVGWTGRGCAYI